jgi:cytochrome c-type biogenesis protein CcmH
VSDGLRRVLAGIVTVALAGIVVAGIAMGEDSEGDRVRSIGMRIKCPVCQGEPIADSPAPLSTEMMTIVAEQVAAGRSDSEIIDYFTDRYGDGVLLDPPFEGRTVALWVLPFVALAAGLALIVGKTRRRSRPDGGES